MSPEEWELIELALKETTRRRGKSQHYKVYPLCGISKCARCGEPMNLGIAGPRVSLICKGYIKGKACGDWQKQAKKAKYGTRSKLYPEADAEVVLALMERAEQIALLGIEHQKQEPPELIALRAEVAKAEALARQDPDFESVAKAKQRKLDAAIAQFLDTGDRYQALELAQKIRSPVFWEELDRSPESKQALYRKLIRVVLVEPRKPVQVVFR